jgi:enolase
MGIKSITPSQVLDSRGDPTLKVKITADNGRSGSFIVPSGASKGAGEAVKKVDSNEKSYGGNTVYDCIELINNAIAPKFIGYPLDHQQDFDSLLIALDGTENKEKIGGNTILALSGAYFKLSAKLSEKPLWQYIAEKQGTSPNFPQIYANIVGGGKHAPGLEIQEFMIVPQSKKPIEAIEQIVQIYKTLRSIMTSLYGPSAKLVSDEGAMAPIGARTEVVLEALSNLNAKSQAKFDIALDAAANSFFDGQTYSFENQKLHASDLMKIYEQLDTKFNITSIEDPFSENDLEGLELIKTMPKEKRGFKVISDDYTVTSAQKIAEFGKDKVFDGVIIKPDQVGSISEMFQAVSAAKELGQEIIVSHRSGESNDSFIVDLAYGLGANGIKIGAPTRGERIAKYNRILEIAYGLDENLVKQAPPLIPVEKSLGFSAKPVETEPPKTKIESTVEATKPAETPKQPYVPSALMTFGTASQVAPADETNSTQPAPNSSTPKITEVNTASNQSYDHPANEEKAPINNNIPPAISV